MQPDVSYLDLTAYKLRSTLAPEELDQSDGQYPGFINARLLGNSAWINARLKKRYVAPFDPVDPPQIVLLWVTALTDLDIYRRRGFNPSSAEDDLVKELYDEAKAEIKEAADSKDGLFDLPLRTTDAAPSGVTKGGPLFYSEQSPYTWTRLQADAGRNEDNNR